MARPFANRNPFLSRLQRHNRVSTLFRAVDPASSPASLAALGEAPSTDRFGIATSQPAQAGVVKAGLLPPGSNLPLGYLLNAPLPPALPAETSQELPPAFEELAEMDSLAASKPETPHASALPAQQPPAPRAAAPAARLQRSPDRPVQAPSQPPPRPVSASPRLAVPAAPAPRAAAGSEDKEDSKFTQGQLDRLQAIFDLHNRTPEAEAAAPAPQTSQALPAAPPAANRPAPQTIQRSLDSEELLAASIPAAPPTLLSAAAPGQASSIPPAPRPAANPPGETRLSQVAGPDAATVVPTPALRQPAIEQSAPVSPAATGQEITQIQAASQPASPSAAPTLPAARLVEQAESAPGSIPPASGGLLQRQPEPLEPSPQPGETLPNATPVRPNPNFAQPPAPQSQPPAAYEAETQLQPLEAVWQVERVPAAPVRPATPAPAAPSAYNPPPVHAEVQRVLQETTPGQPTDSRVETLPPRLPRPSVSAQPPARPSLQRTPEEPAGPQPAAQPAEVVDTAVGPLPADLWRLIGEKPPTPAAVVQTPSRSSSLRSQPEVISPEPLQDLGEIEAPGPAPVLARTQAARSEPPAIGSLQREVDSGGGEPAPAAQPAPAPGEQPPAQAGKPPEMDIEELSRKVYAEVKNRLSIEWERLRNRF